jgi:hypothetical protein
VRKFAASAMAMPLALLSIGVARADSNDDDFVQRAQNVGVSGAPADLIINGHEVCKLLASGSNPDDVADAFVSQMGFKSGVAAGFVAVSVTHYCSQYSNLQFKKPH